VRWTPQGSAPTLELQRGQHDDPLRLYCELDNDLLLDLSIEDDQIPDAPPDEIDGDWAAFIQDADGNYLADVVIDPIIDYVELAHKLRELVEAVRRGERPMFLDW